MTPASDRDRPATTPTQDGFAECLLHPAVLLALVVWLVNDHVAKGMYPGWLTGKLSDVASLIVFPLLPIAGYDLWLRRAAATGEITRRPGRMWDLGWIAATGFVMATINVWDGAAQVYRWGLGIAQWPVRVVLEWGIYGYGMPSIRPVRLTMDPTDLITLPALLVPLYLVFAVRAAVGAEFGAAKATGS